MLRRALAIQRFALRTCALVLAAVATPRITGAQFLAPNPGLRVYWSPGARSRLSVDPATKRAGGSATYRLERDGKLEWTRELPFAWSDAVVRDDGVALGCAWKRDGTCADEQPCAGLSFTRLDAEGGAREVAFVPESGAVMHGPVLPLCTGLSLSLEQDRLVARVVEEDEVELWSFDLPSGALRGKLERPLRASVPLTRTDVAVVVPIEGRRLVALLRCERDLAANPPGATRGVWVEVVDRAGRTLWRESVPTAELCAGDVDGTRRIDWRLRASGSLLTPSGVGRFALCAPETRARTLYEVEGEIDPTGAIVVREVSREVQPLDPFDPRVTDLPSVELVPRDRFPLPIAKPGRLVVDPSGRFLSLRDRKITVHDSHGAELYTCACDDDDERIGRQQISVRDDGWIACDPWQNNWSDGARRSSAAVLFDEHGVRRERRVVAPDGVDGCVSYLPHDRRAWIVDSLGGVHFLSAEEEVVFSRWRATDGSWLRGTMSFAVASDGRLAIVDHDGQIGASGAPPRVIVFGPDGSVGDAIYLPRDVERFHDLVFQSPWIVGKSGRLVFVNTATRRVIVGDLPKVDGKTPWRILLRCPDGDALWLFDPEAKHVEVYDLPRDG